MRKFKIRELFDVSAFRYRFSVQYVNDSCAVRLEVDPSGTWTCDG